MTPANTDHADAFADGQREAREADRKSLVVVLNLDPETTWGDALSTVARLLADRDRYKPLVASLHKQRADAESVVWLTYDPDDRYEEHDSERDGRVALNDLLDQHRDDAAEGVHESVESVALYRCVRVAGIRQTTTATSEDDTDDGAWCRERGFDFKVELSIEDEAPLPPDPRDEEIAALRAERNTLRADLAAAHATIAGLSAARADLWGER